MGWEYRVTKPVPALKKKKIMIIGGGPAGMAATGYLTERGHEVALFEKSDRLGGRLYEASALSFKDGFRRYIEYIIRKTGETGAKIVLGKNVDVETIKAEAPDALVIAVGGKTILPPINGIDGPNVRGVCEVDREEVETGARVVVCGAGLSGTECALGLAMEGKDVTLVDMIEEDEFFGDLTFFNKPTLKRLLADNNVKLMPLCTVTEFTPEGVIIKTADGGAQLLECDTAVAAFGIEPDAAIISELNEVIPETYILGDAFKTGMIGDAIGSAYWLTKDI